MAVLETSMEESKVKKNSPKPNKKALLLIHDLKYARNLASNNEKDRSKSLKYLKRYLEQRSKAIAISEDSLKILWKGLFYSMWMSDKPQMQEDCAENISNLIHSLEFNEAMDFFKIGLDTLQNEWVGIDQLRLDKFLMLVRRLLRQALFVIKKSNFKKACNEAFARVLEETILSTEKTPSLGLVMHFIEIYLEELAKVSDGTLQKSRTIDFLRPYIHKLAFANDVRLIQWITKFIFTHLMRQHKLGLEYEDKYKIWKAHRFEGSINQIQKIIVKGPKNSEKDPDVKSGEKKPMDPRAGHVNVELPLIPFDPKEISEALLIPKTDSRTTSQTRNHLTIWSEKFMSLHKGQYPLGVKKLESKKRKNSEVDTRIKKAAKRLMKFEENLLKRDEKKKKRKNKGEEEEEPPKKKKKEAEYNNLVQNKEETTESNKKHNKNSMKLEAPRNVRKAETIKEANATDVKEAFMDEYNFCFKRNSGVWFVTPEFEAKLDGPKKVKETLNDAPVQTDKITKKRKISENGKIDDLNKNQAERGNEMFVTPKKFIKEFKKRKSGDAIEEVSSKLRGKSRASFKSPEAKLDRSRIPRASISPKKVVVINTKLNESQEIRDHVKRVRSSPQIPFDGSKKPGKPVLKTPVKPSPINPFYKLRKF